VAAAGPGGGGGGAGASQIFTFRQNGTALTGGVEGGAGGRGGGGGETPVAIEDGKADGANVTFRVGTVTYTGTVRGEQIELQRTAATGGGGRGGRGVAAEPAGPRPAIGPPPDGSDPSSGAFVGLGGGGGGRGAAAPAPLVLVRAKR
jgi:beta-galactosidase